MKTNKYFSTFISNSVKMITNIGLLPQRYHFFGGMVKDLNVFPFDNDLKKAHFGTKLYDQLNLTFVIFIRHI
jgi:hypothetical protein